MVRWAQARCTQPLVISPHRQQANRPRETPRLLLNLNVILVEALRHCVVYLRNRLHFATCVLQCCVGNLLLRQHYEKPILGLPELVEVRRRANHMPAFLTRNAVIKPDALDILIVVLALSLAPQSQHRLE
jgi:hypothetical protein